MCHALGITLQPRALAGDSSNNNHNLRGLHWVDLHENGDEVEDWSKPEWLKHKIKDPHEEDYMEWRR